MRFLVFSLFLAAASALVEVENLYGYHERIGIPWATKIREAEEQAIARLGVESARIVGGSIAPTNAYPYLGGLLISFHNQAGTSGCGSSLISATRLVTAAHCWNDGRFTAREFVVVLGSHFLFFGGTRIPTSTVVVHPNWSPPGTLENDVAVIYLPTRVFFSQSIQPVALPHNNLWDSFVGQWAMAAGYGVTSDQQAGLTVNAEVRHVNLQVITVAQCQAVFGFWAQPSNICTSGAGGVGICRGDSGGPLVINSGGQPILVGISSFVASGQCQGGFPSAFARITSFYDFITQNM